MGEDKAFLHFRGRTLAERAVETLQALGLEVSIVASCRQDFASPEFSVIVDRIPGLGPLGGLYTALRHSGCARGYFLPCDTPLITPELFRVLASQGADSQAVVPCDSQGKLHPLCAIYSSSTLPQIEEQIRNGELRVDRIATCANVEARIVKVAGFGIPDAMFFNVNSPEELEKLNKSL